MPKAPQIANSRSLAERISLMNKCATQEAAEKSLLKCLEEPKKSLEERLAEAREGMPLIDHISRIPGDAKFRKTKILLRIKEFEPILEATKICLDPLFEKLNKEEKAEAIGDAVRVSERIRNELWTWWDQFQDIYMDLDTIGHRYTNKQWRELKGVLKRIGKIPFDNLDSRLAEICNELVELKPTFP